MTAPILRRWQGLVWDDVKLLLRHSHGANVTWREV